MKRAYIIFLLVSIAAEWLLGALPCEAQASQPKRPSASSVSSDRSRPPAASSTAKPAPPAPAPTPMPPVIQATVNGSPISETHIQQAIAQRWAIPILRTIIEERLIRQEARRRGIKVSPEEIQVRLERERKRFVSSSAFERYLHAQGLSLQGFIEKLTTDMLLERLLSELTAVSEEEIKSYYLEHQAEFQKPAQARVFLIAVNTIEEAYLVRERLHAGEKFETVAKELSKHPSASKGGDMGWLALEQLSEKALAEAVKNLELGVVSNPIKSGEQYYIVLVRERHPQQLISLSEARPEIRKKLSAQKAISREDYVNMLARKADIQIQWPAAQPLLEEYAALRQIAVFVDEKRLELTQPPFKLPDGTIMVPAKELLQAIGASLSWQAQEKALTANTESGTIKLVVGSPQLIVGKEKPQVRIMPQAPVMREGILFMAPRLPLEALGAKLQWDSLRHRLVIHKNPPQENWPSPTTTPKKPGGLERQ